MQLIFEIYYTNMFIAVTTVVIGLQHTFYSVSEGQGSLDICTVVISGALSGGNVEIGYFTTSGLAEGVIWDYNILQIHLITY